MKIDFVTHNPGKVKEARLILEPDVEVVHIDKEYVEIQDDDPEIVTRKAAKDMAEELQQPVVVEDSGLFITVLKGFPGVYSSPAYRTIGLRGLVRLMEGEGDRECFYRSAVGYCEPGQEPVSFLGEERGSVADAVRGRHGFGHDPIFIPEGETTTYGEHENASELKKFRRLAFEKLHHYLKKRTQESAKD